MADLSAVPETEDLNFSFSQTSDVMVASKVQPESVQDSPESEIDSEDRHAVEFTQNLNKSNALNDHSGIELLKQTTFR
jgi:hypothetical protein